MSVREQEFNLTVQARNLTEAIAEGSGESESDSTTERKPTPRLYRVIWRWHFYAGLLTLPVLLIAAATGALYVFREELERPMYPKLLFVEPKAESVLYADQLAKAQAVLPAGAKVHGFTISDDPTRASIVTAETGHEQYQFVYVNQYTGAVLGQAEYGKTFFDFILTLHRTLFVGTTGRIIVELATSWGIILVITGLYLWWPRDKKLRGVLWPRVSGKSYAIWRDWHTVPGFYFSILAFLVMGTGLFFTFLFGSGYQLLGAATNAYPPNYINPPKSARAEGRLPISLDQVVALARARQPEPRIYVDFPHTGEDSFAIYGGNYDSPSTVSVMYVDQYSGALIDHIRWGQLSALAKTQIASYAIHIGSIFGLPTKILAVLVCLMIIAMTATGAVMWWIRRPRGKTGFPMKQTAFQPAKWLIGLICLLGLLMPAAGLSMLLIVLGDWIYQRMSKARTKSAMG